MILNYKTLDQSGKPAGFPFRYWFYYSTLAVVQQNKGLPVPLATYR